MLSLHTSPLVQPGAGDSGGMNVYVRELASSLAQAGVDVDVFTRAHAPDLPEVVEVEPGLRVRHVPAGAPDLPKEALPDVIDERMVILPCASAAAGLNAVAASKSAATLASTGPRMAG